MFICLSNNFFERDFVVFRHCYSFRWLASLFASNSAMHNSTAFEIFEKMLVKELELWNLASAVSAVLFCACNDPLFSGIPPKRFGTSLMYGDIYCTDCNLVSRLLAYKGKRCRKKIFSLRKPPTFGDATTGFPAKWRLRKSAEIPYRWFLKHKNFEKFGRCQVLPNSFFLVRMVYKPLLAG